MKRQRQTTRSVIVIGAGMSGLACARELVHRGYWVLVVEARQRVGGRLKGESLKIGDDEFHDVDLGGALIHGTEENPIADLTEQLGVSSKPVSDTLLLNKDGWPIDVKEDDKLANLFNQCLEEAFRRVEGKQSKTSFGSLFEEVCKEKGVSTNSLFRWHKVNLEVSCGTSFEQLGWQWNEDEPYGFDGDHSALGPSWKAVVEAMAEPLDILYGSPVEHVHIVHPKSNENVNSPHNAKANASPRAAPQLQKVNTPNPKNFKSSDEIFSPARQSKRLRGVDAENRRSSRVSRGKSVERFTVEHSPTRPTVSSTPRVDPAEAGPKRTLVQVTLQNGNVLEADSVVCTVPLGILKAGDMKFEPPLPVPKRKAIDRLGAGLLNKCVLSFPRVFWQDSDFLGLAGEEHSYLVLNVASYTGGKPILLFMYGGDFAAEIESWTDKDVVKDCLKVLKAACGCTVPSPIDYTVTRWGHEEYSRMSFSFVPPGVDGLAELTAMSQPVYDSTGEIPTLMFAGEHTTPYYPSTIHGAFITGIREAYRLDSVLDPAGNDNLLFQENEVYLRTFPVESIDGDSVHNPSSSVVRSGLLRRTESGGHRHRGASGVMRLRHTSHDKTPPRPNATPSPRRSQRSVTAASPDEALDDDSVAADTKLEGMLDRSLIRGVESYGQDFDFVRGNVLPVYGSSIQATTPEVRGRCRLLINEKKSNKEYPTSASSWRTWGARTIYSSSFVHRDRKSAKPPPTKRRAAMVQSPPPPTLKTKSGRKVSQTTFFT